MNRTIIIIYELIITEHFYVIFIFKSLDKRVGYKKVYKYFTNHLTISIKMFKSLKIQKLYCSINLLLTLFKV